MFCQQCGAQIEEETVFCPKCGTRVKKEIDIDKKADLIQKEEKRRIKSRF